MIDAGTSSGGRTFGRYLALQVPGWILVTLVGMALEQGSLIPGRGTVALLAFWVLKDLLLYPWLRAAYLPVDGRPSSKLVGASALAEQELAPEGLVRVGRELWRASLEGDAPAVPRGTRVEVKTVRGLTLIVAPERTPGEGRPKDEPQH